MKNLLHTTCNVHRAHSRHSHAWRWKRFTVTNFRYLVRFEREYICSLCFCTLLLQFSWSIASLLFVFCMRTLRLNAVPWKWLEFWELPLNSNSMIKRCAEKKNQEKFGTNSKYGKIHFIKLNVFLLFRMNLYVCVSERNRKKESEEALSKTNVWTTTPKGFYTILFFNEIYSKI